MRSKKDRKINGKKALIRAIANYLLATAPRQRACFRETDIARRFHVSRTPVREALHHLEQQGLIERSQRAGTKVRRFGFRDIRDTYDVRKVLEGLAARLAADRITPAALRRLDALIKTMKNRANLNNRRRRYMADLQFHRLIVDACGNRRLADIIESAHMFTKAYLIYYQIRPPLVPRQPTSYTHEMIAKTLAKRDANEAERVAREHVEEAKENLLRHYMTLHNV